MRFYMLAAVMVGVLLLQGCAITPSPLAPELVGEHAAATIAAVEVGQAPLSGPISLSEAVDRALRYNLDHRVEAAQTSLRLAELDLAHYNLLPNTVANSGYVSRSNRAAASSFNLLTQTQNFGVSTSQDSRAFDGDLAFSWNVLDFGLSYIRAHQAADKALIGEELQRKIRLRLIEEVKSAYWRAYAFEKLAARMRKLEPRAKGAISSNLALAKEGDASPLAALTGAREIVEVRRSLKELEREGATARAQLAALMNLRPGTPFQLRLEVPPSEEWRLPEDPRELMRLAVERRPELRENLYQQRIALHEADAALLELLPGIQLYANGNFDTNSYLLNNDWVSLGAKASWNLLRVFQYGARRQVIASQEDVLRERALAIAMTVMTQVHVARLRVHHFKSELALADDFLAMQQLLVRQVRAETGAGRVSENVLLREELNLALAATRRDMAFSSLQSARAALWASVGYEPAWSADWNAVVAVSQPDAVGAEGHRSWAAVSRASDAAVVRVAASPRSDPK